MFSMLTHLRRLACGSVARGEGVLIGRDVVDCARKAHASGAEINRKNNKGSQEQDNNLDFGSRLLHNSSQHYNARHAGPTWCLHTNGARNG